MENGYTRGTVDKTLFLTSKGKEIIIVQIYLDDIIFGAAKQSLCDEFSR